MKTLFIAVALTALAWSARAMETLQFAVTLTRTNEPFDVIGRGTFLLTSNQLAYLVITPQRFPAAAVIEGPPPTRETIDLVGPFCSAEDGCGFDGETHLTDAQASELRAGLWSAAVDGVYRGQLRLSCISEFRETNAVQFFSVFVGFNPDPPPRFVRWGRAMYGLSENTLSYQIVLPAAYGPYGAVILQTADAGRSVVFNLGTLTCAPFVFSNPPPDLSGLELLPLCAAQGSICLTEGLTAELLGGRLAIGITTPPGAISLLSGIAPVDSDGDGVPDFRDVCPNTPAGAIVNGDGCSIAQLCPCAGPWLSHGEYVNCVKEVTAAFAGSGLITETHRRALVNQAAQSDCGKR